MEPSTRHFKLDLEKALMTQLSFFAVDEQSENHTFRMRKHKQYVFSCLWKLLLKYRFSVEITIRDSEKLLFPHEITVELQWLEH